MGLSKLVLQFLRVRPEKFALLTLEVQEPLINKKRKKKKAKLNEVAKYYPLDQ